MQAKVKARNNYLSMDFVLRNSWAVLADRQFFLAGATKRI